MKSDIQLNTLPTSNDLEIIEKWLIEESNSLNAGFYCNWNIIDKAFRNKKLFTIGINNEPVGFIVWSKGEIYVDLDIMEIKPEMRFKGIDNEFFNKFSEYIKEQGFLAINIECSPPESEKFWRKMGFIKFPDRGYTESDLNYYKPLIEVQTISFDRTAENVVELWDLEPHKIRDIHPKWVWNIEMEDDKLTLPIIQPCNDNWNLRWTKNGVVVKEEKVKYFSTKVNQIDYSPFLYIKELRK